MGNPEGMTTGTDCGVGAADPANVRAFLRRHITQARALQLAGVRTVVVTGHPVSVTEHLDDLLDRYATAEELARFTAIVMCRCPCPRR